MTLAFDYVHFRLHDLTAQHDGIVPHPLLSQNVKTETVASAMPQILTEANRSLGQHEHHERVSLTLKWKQYKPDSAFVETCYELYEAVPPLTSQSLEKVAEVAWDSLRVGDQGGRRYYREDYELERFQGTEEHGFLLSFNNKDMRAGCDIPECKDANWARGVECGLDIMLSRKMISGWTMHDITDAKTTWKISNKPLTADRRYPSYTPEIETFDEDAYQGFYITMPEEDLKLDYPPEYECECLTWGAGIEAILDMMEAECMIVDWGIKREGKFGWIVIA